MPYTDGLGAAIANPFLSKRTIVAPRMGSLAMRLQAALAAKKAATARKKAATASRPVVNIFRRGIVPVLKMPNIGPAITPIAPTVVTAQNIPFSASGGGPVSSGAPSPIMSTVPEEQAVDDGSAPAQAGMSPVVMLLLAGTAVAFLLRKKR